MTQAELTAEILRLYRGFRSEDLLTPERLQALSDGLLHLPLGPLRDAVTRALRDPKLPWYDRLQELVEHELEADRQTENLRRERDAKRFANPAWQPPPGTPDPAWALAHKQAIDLLVAGDRPGAMALLASVGSSADLAPTVPSDGGAWLRTHGLASALWPPNFLDQRQLDAIGWPWPEWPARRSSPRRMAAMAARQLSEFRAVAPQDDQEGVWLAPGSPDDPE